MGIRLTLSDGQWERIAPHIIGDKDAGHGRAPRGERLKVGVPHGYWKTTTGVAALTLRGMIAPFVLSGPINRDAFEAYVCQVLVPELCPGDIMGT